MRILITGVHGFVGTNLVKALSAKNIILGLDIVSPEKEGVKFTYGWESLDNQEKLPEVDAIIHLAGIIIVKVSVNILLQVVTNKLYKGCIDCTFCCLL